MNLVHDVERGEHQMNAASHDVEREEHQINAVLIAKLLSLFMSAN